MSITKMFISFVVVAVLGQALIAPATTSALAAKKSECQKTVKHPAQCAKVAATGHRAREYAGRVSENTMLAFQEAYKHGVGVETDTWRLADDNGNPNQGISVIFHDNNLCPVVTEASLKSAGLLGCKDANGKYYTMGVVTYAQFKKFRTKGGQPLITADRAIKYCARHKMPCMIEIKYGPKDPVAFANLIKAEKGLPYVSVYQKPVESQGCSTNAVDTLRDLGITSGIKYDETSTCLMDITDFAKYKFVSMHMGILTPEYVSELHAAGLKVGNMVARTKADWGTLVDSKVDYIIAPHPAQLDKWLRG